MATTAEPADTMQPTGIEEDATSSKDRTFGITEIHEAILINLDMKTLLLAQRVSRDWQKLIDTSPSLQKKLFMQPATAQEAIELGITQGNLNTFLEDDSFAALNPLLINPKNYALQAPCTFSLNFNGNPSWKKMWFSQPPVPGDQILLSPFKNDFVFSRPLVLRYQAEGYKPKKLEDYEPVEEASQRSRVFLFVIRQARGLLSHAELMQMKDSPPEEIDTFAALDPFS